MTRPTENSAISQEVIIGVTINMVGFPASSSYPTPITPHQFLTTIPAYPLCYIPTRFNSAITKRHITPPWSMGALIIALVRGMSSYMLSGRIGVWVGLESHSMWVLEC